jgi:hypothetical protein
MNTEPIKAQIKDMEIGDVSIIARAVLDELLYAAGSQYRSLDDKEVVDIINSHIKIYGEIKEEEHEIRRNQNRLEKVS